MARTPDLKRHAFWRECIGRQADSGLTIAQFCAREGLGVFHVQSYFTETPLPGYRPHRSSPRIVRPIGFFLPVSLCAPRRAALPTSRCRSKADLPNGVRLRIPTANPHLACRVVRAVAAAKTRPGGSR